MGHHGEISWARPALQIRQVLADCGHVCFLLHDSCYDSRPAPCHLLPVAGLPRGSGVPLEHPCYSGMGLGAGPQPATGKGRRTHIYKQHLTGIHTRIQGKKKTGQETGAQTQTSAADCIFSSMRSLRFSYRERKMTVASAGALTTSFLLRSVRFSSFLAQKWLRGSTSAGVTSPSRGD